MGMWRMLRVNRPGRRADRLVRQLSLVLLTLLMSALAAGTRAEPLDCTEFFAPSSGSSFPFVWREDRCEGLVREKTSFHPQSIKISYFGYGDIARAGVHDIANSTDTAIELRGELMSKNTFYRLVARLSPGQVIRWRYPEPLVKEYGSHPERIGMLAVRPGATEDLHRPFTVSGSQELTLGIFSTDFRFNSAEVIAYDAALSEVCRHTYDFHRVIPPLEQKTFTLDLCGKNLAMVRRISVVAMLRLPGEQRRDSKRDVIWIE